jgi:hypothetical protein
LTIFLAGPETTANALTLDGYLLSQHPSVERRLHEEVDTVLGRRPPEMAVSSVSTCPVRKRGHMQKDESPVEGSPAGRRKSEVRQRYDTVNLELYRFRSRRRTFMNYLLGLPGSKAHAGMSSGRSVYRILRLEKAA